MHGRQHQQRGQAGGGTPLPRAGFTHELQDGGRAVETYRVCRDTEFAEIQSLQVYRVCRYTEFADIQSSAEIQSSTEGKLFIIAGEVTGWR